MNKDTGIMTSIRSGIWHDNPGLVQLLGQHGQIGLPGCQHGVDLMPPPVRHERGVRSGCT